MEYLHCYSFETIAGRRSRNVKKTQTKMKKFCLSRRRNMQMTMYTWRELLSVISALSRIVPSKLLKKVNVTKPASPWDILNWKWGKHPTGCCFCLCKRHSVCGAWYVTVVKHSWNCNGLDTRVFKIVKVPACYWNCCIAIVGVMSYFIVLILFPNHNTCSFMNFIKNLIKILDRLNRASLLNIVATFVFLRGSEICRERLKID